MQNSSLFDTISSCLSGESGDGGKKKKKKKKKDKKKKKKGKKELWESEWPQQIDL